MRINRYLAFLGVACFGLSIGTPRRAVSTEPALPEDVAIKLVGDLSDKLAIKLEAADCGEFNEILDEAQSDAANGSTDSSIIMQVLEDVKTNPKLRTLAITKLGDPLLTKTLDCNLIPVSALGEQTSEIQDLDQLNQAIIALLGSADCPRFNQILDEAQVSAEVGNEDDTLGVNQLLSDAKTNPETRTMMIEALGEPLLSQVLDCNLIPFSALR